MNAEQKQRIAHEISNWRDYDLCEAETATESDLIDMCSKMAALLQELINAPEAEPVAWRYEDAFGTHFTEDYSEISNNPGILSFTPLYTSTPASSVPDGSIECEGCKKWKALAEGNVALAEIAQRRADRAMNLIANKATADVARDAERYRWLRHGDNDEKVLQRGPVDPNYVYLPRNSKLDEIIDAAMSEKGQL